MNLTNAEKLAILSAADHIIMQGGRSLLAKILKGSRDKKLLEHGLDKTPNYGYFQSETIAQITEKVDWMIEHDFLEISYSGKLPMIVFTARGWKIQSDQYSGQLLKEWDKWLDEDSPIPNMEYLKDRNRELIHLLLDKVEETRDTKYIPILEAWEAIDYKKVRQRIRSVIKVIKENPPVDVEAIHKKEAEIEEALVGEAPQDLRLKCWECGNRFILTVGEQDYFKRMSFHLPKRCQTCRDERNAMIYGED